MTLKIEDSGRRGRFRARIDDIFGCRYSALGHSKAEALQGLEQLVRRSNHVDEGTRAEILKLTEAEK